MSAEASGGIIAVADSRFSVADWSRGAGKKITGAVAAGLRRALARPRRLRAGRDLAGLSDALLRDIGVSHGEIAFMAHRFAGSRNRNANADH